MKDTNSNDSQLKIEISLAESKFGKILENFPFFSLSEKIKKGFKEEYILRDGLKIVINEYKLRRNIVVDYSISQAPLEFAYCLSGELAVEVISDTGLTDLLNITNGSSAVFYLPNTYGKMTISGKEYLKILSIHVSPDYLKNFIEQDFDDFPKELSNLTNSKSPSPFLFLNKMNVRMIAAANHILDNLLSGAPKKMFLESKALEMMSLSVAELVSDEANEIQISDFIMQQIVDLEKFIRNNPTEEFPSLMEIAQKIGLSHSKLNKIFRNLYGNTIFGYIREIRLFKSKELLEKNNLTITEIAYLLRWSSPAHFARDFKEKFQTSPKQFQKSMRIA